MVLQSELLQSNLNQDTERILVSPEGIGASGDDKPFTHNRLNSGAVVYIQGMLVNNNNWV